MNNSSLATNADTPPSDVAGLGEVQETMLVPLLARAYETRRPDAIIRDYKAIEILESLGTDMPGIQDSWLMQLSVAIRTEVFDQEVRRFIASRDEPVVVNLGSGLDGRFERVDDGRVRWFDVDLADALRVRRHFYAESPRRRFLAASAFGEEWWGEAFAGPGDQVLVLAEGLLMYFPQATVHTLFRNLAQRVPGGQLLFESISPQITGTQNRVAGLEEQSAPWVWGIKSGAEIAALDPRIHHEADFHFIDRHRRRWRWLAWLSSLPGVGNHLRQTFKLSLVSFAPAATSSASSAGSAGGAEKSNSRDGGRGRSEAGVFPLPLTVFERYMLLDDRPTHPMTFFLRMRFHGDPDRERLQAALHAAIERHPLLNSLVEGRGRRRSWVPSPLPPPRIHWIDWGQEPNLAGGVEAIDLAEEPGLRVWCESRPGECRVLAQFHHACCDGVGGLRFLGDWLARYDADVRGVEPRWPEVDLGLLPERGRRRWADVKPVEAEGAAGSRAIESALWLLRKPLPLATLSGADASGTVTDRAPFPGLESITLSKEATRGLSATARERGATLNDLLIHALMRALADWSNHQSRPPRPGDWLQINVPTSLRDAQDAGLPAANVLGYVFPARRRRECTEAASEALLTSLADEMKRVRDEKQGERILVGMAQADSLPGALAATTRSGSCQATAILSNVGDVTRRFGARLPRDGDGVTAGGLRLVGFEGVPPLRPQTNATVAATFYSGQITLNARTDRLALPSAGTRELLERIVAMLPVDPSDL